MSQENNKVVLRRREFGWRAHPSPSFAASGVAFRRPTFVLTARQIQSHPAPRRTAWQGVPANRQGIGGVRLGRGPKAAHLLDTSTWEWSS